MKNLVCCICDKEITIDSKVAKIVFVKRTQHNEAISGVEYLGDQEELYIHFNCLKSNRVPVISCRANNKNFNQCDSRIINVDETILNPIESENTELTRNNILNFLKD